MRSNDPVRLAVFLLFLGTLVGCDQISSFFDYFSGKKTQQTTTAAQARVEPSTTAASASAASPATKSGSNQPLPPNVLARVGNWTITIGEFKERLQALKEAVPDYDIKNVEQNKLLLDELVRQQLLVQDAERSGLAQEKNVVAAVEEFRRTLIVREAASRLIKGMEATEEEAKKYYEDNKNDFVEQASYHVREVVVDTEEEAKNIVVELYKGTDFGEVVKTYSKAKSAWNKGDLGFITAFAFPKMEQVVQGLEVGGISNPFKGPEGVYVVKLEEKKGGVQKPFEEIKGDIKTGLTLLKQQQKILSYIDELAQKTPVEVNAKLLEE